jgi:uncharacterized protein (TIGR03790 family)
MFRPARQCQTHFTARAILRCVFGLVVVFCTASHAVAELTPNDIVLVVNTKLPASRALAEAYARLRHIPDGRIVGIEIASWGVSNPPEEIPFDAYEPIIAKPVRDFLVKSGLGNTAKCLVTFYGVPLRIGRRQLTSAEQDELASLKQQLDQDRQSIAAQIAAVEKQASDLDPTFKPQTGTDMPILTARFQAAITSAFRSASSIKDASARQTTLSKLTASMDQLLGKSRSMEILAQPAVSNLLAHPPTPADVTAAKESLLKADRDMGQAFGYQGDPAGRKQVLELSRSSMGSLGAASILSSQIDTFRVDESESAVDSELALLWWHGYPRFRWLSNPLHWRALAKHVNAPPTLMVTRIDAPSEMLARNLIKTSFDIEQKGLTGQIVLDARGKPSTDPYGQYDQTIRNLNQLLHDRTSLPVTFDDQESLIPARSVKDPIALYCGWYSLRNYVPPGPFAPGAVGFHIASLELVSLHARSERGWVHGLVTDGVCATVGPVAEPYLQSFPGADEFFPLLLTGKLTMAEVYWRTTPMVSWMQSCVADPLYTPFKTNPVLKVEDLPKPVRVIFEQGQ